MQPSRFLLVQREGECLVVTPTTNLGELQCLQIGFEKAQLLKLFEDRSVINVVVDFRATEYLGSTALTLLVNLKEITTGRGGHMVLCNVSDHVKDILAAANLEDYWWSAPSREEALLEVMGSQLTVSDRFKS
jgi:anti-anti-sigma factor